MAQTHFETAVEKRVQELKDQMLALHLDTPENIARANRSLGTAAGLIEALKLFREAARKDVDPEINL